MRHFCIVLSFLLLCGPTLWASPAGTDRDTLSRVVYQPNFHEWIVPSALLVGATAITLGGGNKDLFNLPRPIHPEGNRLYDDLGQYIPAAGVFVADIFAQEKHHPIDQLFLMGGSYVVTGLAVNTVKHLYHSPRPDNKGNDSFPSGHTSKSFVGAHIFYKEFKDHNIYLALSGYVFATTVGAARVYHDRHWVSDVMAGAAVAMLSTELVYWAYFPVRNWVVSHYNRNLRNDVSLVPMVGSDYMGMHLSFRF